MAKVAVVDIIADARKAIDEYEKMYLANSKTHPEYYPLTLPQDNAGVIVEQICDKIWAHT
jgi:hypothetical protein